MATGLYRIHPNSREKEMSDKERQQPGKNRRKRGVLRELIENTSPEDLRSFLCALGAMGEASEDLIELETAELVESLIFEPSKDRTQFGILEFQKQTADHSLGWSMRWLDQGTERTVSGIAESDGDDLVLLGLPSNIRALELISGQGLYEDRFKLDCIVDLDSRNEPTIRLADSFPWLPVDSYENTLAAAAADDEDESESLWRDELQLAASSPSSEQGLKPQEIDECTVHFEAGQLSIILETTRENLSDEQFAWLEWSTGTQQGRHQAQLILVETQTRVGRKILRFKIVLTRDPSGIALPNSIEDLLAAGNVNQVSLHLRTSLDIIKDPKSSTSNSSNRIYIGFYSEGEEGEDGEVPVLRFRNGARVLDASTQMATPNQNYLLRFEKIEQATGDQIEQLATKHQDNEDLQKLIRWVYQINDREVANQIGHAASSFFEETGSNRNRKEALKKPNVPRLDSHRVVSFLKDTVFFPSIIHFHGAMAHDKTREKFTEKNGSGIPSDIEIVECAGNALLSLLPKFFERFENHHPEQRSKACRELLLFILESVHLYWHIKEDELPRYCNTVLTNKLNQDRRKDTAGGDRYVSHLRAIGDLMKIGNAYYSDKFSRIPMDRDSIAKLARDSMFSADEVESFLLVIVNAADQLLEDQQRSRNKTTEYSWKDFFLAGLGLLLTKLARGTTEKEILSAAIRRLFFLPTVISIHSPNPDEGKGLEANLKDSSKSDTSYSERGTLDGFVSSLQKANPGPQTNAKLYAWLHQLEELPDLCTNEIIKEVQQKLSTNSRPSREAMVTEIRTKFGFDISVDTLRTWERSIERKWCLWQVVMHLQNKEGNLQPLLTEEQSQRLKDRIFKEGLRSKPVLDDPINCMVAVLALYHNQQINSAQVDFLEQWLFRKDTDESLLEMDLMQGVLGGPSTDTPASQLKSVKNYLSSLVLAKLLTSTITGAEVPLTNRQANKNGTEGDKEFSVAMDLLMDNPFKILEPMDLRPVHHTIAKALWGITYIIPEEFKAFHRDRLLGKLVVKHRADTLQTGKH